MNKEQNQYVAYNYDIYTVFNAIIAGVNYLSGFSVTQADQQNFIITVDKSLSMWTWGETIIIRLNVNQATNQTYVYFSSDSKLGTEFAAKKQNRKNIEEIIGATNNFLMSQQPQYQQPMMQQQPNQYMPQPMPQQQMTQPMPQQMPAQPQQQVSPQPIQSTQHQGDALSNNLNNM